MLHCDGVVVFDTSGQIRAFRTFLDPTPEEKRSIPDQGGGRRRAFELMTGRVKRGEYVAALFRSQDGDTKCVEDENAR